MILKDFVLTCRFPAWLPGRHGSRPWSEHGAAAAAALLDVAAPAVSLPASGLRRRRTILRREEVEQHVGLLVDRLPATRLQQRPRRGSARSLHGEVLTVIGAGRGRMSGRH